MRRVFPDRPIVEIDNADPIFHVVYDLDDRYQVPGQWALVRVRPIATTAQRRIGAEFTTTMAASW